MSGRPKARIIAGIGVGAMLFALWAPLSGWWSGLAGAVASPPGTQGGMSAGLALPAMLIPAVLVLIAVDLRLPIRLWMIVGAVVSTLSAQLVGVASVVALGVTGWVNVFLVGLVEEVIPVAWMLAGVALARRRSPDGL